MRRFLGRWSGALAGLLLATPNVSATWSIILVDHQSKEVAIGSATCLLNFNLRRYLPVVRVDQGAAAAQSFIDLSGQNRVLIWEELQAGTDPAAMLDLLEAQDDDHQTRQYGIVDTQGRAVTFSGTDNGAYANGVTGSIGSIVYAIQGNVITGQAVIDAAEAAVLDTPGAIPEKLMAAMEAAYAMGGDGRCSCSDADPTGCGAPPPTFEKSAHCGFMIVTRRGDIDGTCNGGSLPCANGTYYLALNISFQLADDPDPVLQLRDQFDAWRSDLVAAPDAVESTATVLEDDKVVNNGAARTLRIQVNDWQGLPVASAAAVTVSHEADSASASTIGTVIDLGGGAYEVALTATAAVGVDRFAVQVTDSLGVVRHLIPSPRLLVQDAAADLDGDGVVDLSDLGVQLANWGGTGGGDIDGDGDVDLSDLGAMLVNFQPGF